MAHDPMFTPDPIDITVGLHVRTLRKQRSMSQEQLGRALGVTFQQVQKYERGANRISASMLVRTAKALGVSAASLLPGADAEPAGSPEVLSLLGNTRGASELVEAFGAIRSARARRGVLLMVRSLGPAGDEVGHEHRA